MEPITITKDEVIIAHHTTDSPMSRYGQLVWVVENDDLDPGDALWQQGDNKVELKVLGVLGGWLVAAQPDGLLIGIIWSDGCYYANLVEDRASKQPISIDQIDGSGVTDLIWDKDEVMQRLKEGCCQVKGTIAIGSLDVDSPLGFILS